MPQKVTPIYLKDSEKYYLQSIIQKGTVEARVYRRAKVQAALEDFSGRGRKPEIFDHAKAWVVNIVCQKPCDLGLSAELWYPTSLTKYIKNSRLSVLKILSIIIGSK